jgi:hypothetical protein
MENIEKFWASLRTLKADAVCNVKDDILTEEDFNNNIEWITGTSSDGTAIETTTNPHSEITWTKVKEEMDKL